ncbi:PIN-like domain-containing protein [Chryseobacterium paridis]|uniref:PIN like domain-containing protein n=1 Tax=Chryseobacterium paridis TaxID=2800328 RepID=A0ABS1FTN7_9FLAO|nr:PIN-like domain-containing protein [Chryseobacterium paridis]MBK1895794.1 hypothetical protein [Chryseobacterium paridis]
MKAQFRGYYPLTEDEIKVIWKDGFITLDTNVLFNLYRYSDETRKELLKIIRKYSKQIFLTHQSAFEFHKNRITVISEQITIYDETIKSFLKLENDIVKNLKTPHLSKKVLENFKKSLSETIKDLEFKKLFFLELLKKDTILDSISNIFIDKKIGVPFNKKEIGEIEKEGNERYLNKIPPGYKDNDKKTNKFGDLIIWKELLKESKNKSKPFIFIIDDVKEDWWLRTNGQTLSPRPELLQESYQESNQLFHLYTTDRFLEFASQSEEIQQETIDEVKEINHWQNSNINYLSAINFNESLNKNLHHIKLFESLKNLNEFNENLSFFSKNSYDLDILKKYIKIRNFDKDNDDSKVNGDGDEIKDKE